MAGYVDQGEACEVPSVCGADHDGVSAQIRCEAQRLSRPVSLRILYRILHVRYDEFDADSSDLSGKVVVFRADAVEYFKAMGESVKGSVQSEAAARGSSN